MIGYIYKLTSPQTTDIYIGSTIQKLYNRFNNHKQSLKGHYITSFEILKYDDCEIKLLETKEIKNRKELFIFEGEWIKKLDCVNKYIAGRTQKEYVIDNKEKTETYQKEYRETHKEEKSLTDMIWRNNNAEHKKQKDKEYYIKNAEKIKQQRLKRYYLNK